YSYKEAPAGSEAPERICIHVPRGRTYFRDRGRKTRQATHYPDPPAQPLDGIGGNSPGEYRFRPRPKTPGARSAAGFGRIRAVEALQTAGPEPGYPSV